MPITVTHVTVGAGQMLRLDGRIDESLHLGPTSHDAREVVIIDLTKVPEISSHGVRLWRELVPALKAGYLGFVGVRPQLMAQFNSVARFACGGELLSFFAPYTCTSCGHYQELLINLREQHDIVKAQTPPAVTCEKCAQPSEFDDIAEAYFYYAAYAPTPAPPPLARQILDNPERRGLPFRADKDVVENVNAMWLSGSLDKTVNLKRLLQGLEGVLVLLADGLDMVSVEGLKRLQLAVDGCPVPAFLARVPPVLASALIDNPQIVGKQRIVSLWGPLACAKCHRSSEHAIDRTLLEGLQQGSAKVVCQSCGGGLELPASAPLPTLASPADVPAEVAEYLREHHQRPTFNFGPEHAGPTNGMLGRYELLERIGAGGMAEVFLARQTGMGGFQKKVAIKRILPHLANNQAFIAQFLDEARIAVRLSHPNVVQTLDVGQTGNQYFIALEYVHGLDLARLLELSQSQSRRLPLGIATHIIAAVCAGLQAAHSSTTDEGSPRPIIHRDISPHNVLISLDGQVKISDFGIAKAADGHNSATPAASVRGKFAYLAPEVLQGSRTFDASVDIYAAGVTLYQCLTLELPFRRDSEASLIMALMKDPVPPASDKRAEIPAALSAVLTRAMERDVTKRYSSAEHMGRDLNACLDASARAETSDVKRWIQSMVGATGSGEITGSALSRLRYSHQDLDPTPTLNVRARR